MEHEKVPRLMVIISKLAGVVFRHVVFRRCIATIQIVGDDITVKIKSLKVAI